MFEKQIKIPEPEEITDKMPLPENLKGIKAERDRLVTEVITGKSEKLIMIIGPCSAHEQKPVLEYVERLGRLNDRVKDKLVLVPRIYTNKPRTRGVGYKGMFSQPDPNKSEDILKGIYAIRELNIKAIEASGLAAGGRDAVSGKHTLRRRPSLVYSGGSALLRKSASPPRGERSRRASGREKSDERIYTCSH